MNWFERYGIIGMSFYLFLLLLFFTLSVAKFVSKGEGIPPNVQQKNEPTLLLECKNNSIEIDYKIAGAVIGSTFLPIGYLLSVFSQGWYYLVSRFTRLGIHQRIHKKLKNKYNDDIYGLKDEKDEGIIESDLTYWDRMRMRNDGDLERIKFFAKHITKRFDVIAINSGIIFAMLGASLIVVICKGEIFELLRVLYLYLLADSISRLIIYKCNDNDKFQISFIFGIVIVAASIAIAPQIYIQKIVISSLIIICFVLRYLALYFSENIIKIVYKMFETHIWDC